MKKVDYNNQQIIKVITGIRRCGKSTLLAIYQDYLKDNGVKNNQIISINFEDADYEELQDRKNYMHILKQNWLQEKDLCIFR